MLKFASIVIGAEIVFAGTFGIGVMTAHGTAYAQPSEVTTVDGVDYPVCHEEDCSDQPGQIGVWFDRSGQGWLSLGERSFRVVR